MTAPFLTTRFYSFMNTELERNTNLNAHLTEPLEELIEYLHVDRDEWRESSYKVVLYHEAILCVSDSNS
jgi:hypothetical protein